MNCLGYARILNETVERQSRRRIIFPTAHNEREAKGPMATTHCRTHVTAQVAGLPRVRPQIAFQQAEHFRAHVTAQVAGLPRVRPQIEFQQADLPTIAQHMFSLMLRNVASDGFRYTDPVNPGSFSLPGCVIAAPSFPANTPGVDQDYVFNWTARCCDYCDGDCCRQTAGTSWRRCPTVDRLRPVCADLPDQCDTDDGPCLLHHRRPVASMD